MKRFLLLLLPLIFVSCATTNLTVEEQECLNTAYELKKACKVGATSFEILSNEEFDERFPGGWAAMTCYENGWSVIYLKSKLKRPGSFRSIVCHELAHAKMYNKYAKSIHHTLEWYYCFLEFADKTGVCNDKDFGWYRDYLIKYYDYKF